MFCFVWLAELFLKIGLHLNTFMSVITHKNLEMESLAIRFSVFLTFPICWWSVLPCLLGRSRVGRWDPVGSGNLPPWVAVPGLPKVLFSLRPLSNWICNLVFNLFPELHLFLCLWFLKGTRFPFLCVRTFGYEWSLFGYHMGEERGCVLLGSGGRSQGSCWVSCKAQDNHCNKELSGPNVSSTEIEKPWSRSLK